MHRILSLSLLYEGNINSRDSQLRTVFITAVQLWQGSPLVLLARGLADAVVNIARAVSELAGAARVVLRVAAHAIAISNLGSNLLSFLARYLSRAPASVCGVGEYISKNPCAGDIYSHCCSFAWLLHTHTGPSVYIHY